MCIISGKKKYYFSKSIEEIDFEWRQNTWKVSMNEYILSLFALRTFWFYP